MPNNFLTHDELDERIRNAVAKSAIEGYMLDHEHHIAWETNDFGDLKEAFRITFGREPSKDIE